MSCFDISRCRSLTEVWWTVAYTVWAATYVLFIYDTGLMRGDYFFQEHLKKTVTLGSNIPSPAIIKFLWQIRGEGERRREKHTDVRASRVEDRGQRLVTWASNRLVFPFLPLQHNGLTLQCFSLTVTFKSFSYTVLKFSLKLYIVPKLHVLQFINIILIFNWKGLWTNFSLQYCMHTTYFIERSLFRFPNGTLSLVSVNLKDNSARNLQLVKNFI